MATVVATVHTTDMVIMTVDAVIMLFDAGHGYAFCRYNRAGKYKAAIKCYIDTALQRPIKKFSYVSQ